MHTFAPCVKELDLPKGTHLFSDKQAINTMISMLNFSQFPVLDQMEVNPLT